MGGTEVLVAVGGSGVLVAVGSTVGVLVAVGLPSVAVGCGDPVGPLSTTRLSKFVAHPFELPSVAELHVAPQLVANVLRWPTPT